MDAHELDEHGKIINTIVVNDLNFPGKHLVDAAVGGNIGDSIINGFVVKYVDPVIIPKEVSKKQARLALLSAGYYDKVIAIIDNLPEDQKTVAKIQWDDSESYQRDHPFVLMMATALGLTSDELDALFVAASEMK